MALNIPMPESFGSSLLKGLGSGGNLFTQMIRPVIERENMARQWRQHLDQLAIQKEASARAAAAAAREAELAPIRKNLLLQRLKHARDVSDPNYEINQLLAAENLFGGDGRKVQGVPAPKEMSGEGMGLFSPEGLMEAQNTPIEEKSEGINLELLKQHPALRGYFKKKFGYDPLAESGRAYHGAARDAYDLQRLKNEVGENSEVYQNAQRAYESQLDAKKDLADLRARTKAGLKVGEKEFFDPETGVPLGKEIPLTSKERESEEGNILFNELYPIVYKGASPFSGEGSITRLEQAAANYKKDPIARKLFDDFLLADKMLAATVVNEASTLKAGRTNQTYKQLKESLDAQDIPVLIKDLIKQYKIPASASLKAAMRYQEALSNARKKARKSTPATQRLYYNPEMQVQHEMEKEATPTNQNTYKDTDIVRVETPDGTVKTMTYAEAKKLGAE